MRKIIEGRQLISAYNKGGFRFGQIKAPGSILILPRGIYEWDVQQAEDLAEPAFSGLDLKPGELGDFFLFGTGHRQIFPDVETRAAFDRAGAGIEPMDTGAACRTYNILLAEQRIFSAGLIAL